MADHKCHHPSCEVLVPPAKFACRSHWYSLPIALRNRIWREYRPGQERDKNPSRQYLDVAIEALNFWRGQEKSKIDGE